MRPRGSGRGRRARARTRAKLLRTRRPRSRCLRRHRRRRPCQHPPHTHTHTTYVLDEYVHVGSGERFPTKKKGRISDPKMGRNSVQFESTAHIKKNLERSRKQKIGAGHDVSAPTHPQSVAEGSASPSSVLRDFVSHFSASAGGAPGAGTAEHGHVPHAAFVAYYECESGGVHDDTRFEALMKQCWHLTDG